MVNTKAIIILRKYPFGGAERQADLLIKSLKDKNIKVDIISIESKNSFNKNESRIFALNQTLVGLSLSPFSIIKNFKLYKSIIKLVKNKYDIIITFSQLYLIGLIFKKIKTFISIRMFYPNTKSTIKVYLLKKFNMIITNNLPQYSLLNALEIKSILTNNTIEPKSITSKYKNNKKFKCLIISNYSKRKNIEVVLKAFKKIDRNAFELKIIGYNKNLPQNYKSYNQKNISWVGHVSEDKIINYYEKFDCLIHASLREGASNAILDAMCYGMPVLASRIPENISLIGNNSNFLFNSNDSDELVQRIEQLSLLKNTPDIKKYLDYQKLKIKNDYSTINNEDLIKEILY